MSSTLPPAPPTPAPPTGLMAQQPLFTVGMLTTLVAGAAELLVEFGLSVTPGQEAALEKFIVLAWPVVAFVWAWFRVYSPHSTQKAINEAALAGRSGTEPPKVSGASKVVGSTSVKGLML